MAQKILDLFYQWAIQHLERKQRENRKGIRLIHSNQKR